MLRMGSFEIIAIARLRARPPSSHVHSGRAAGNCAGCQHIAARVPVGTGGNSDSTGRPEICPVAERQGRRRPTSAAMLEQHWSHDHIGEPRRNRYRLAVRVSAKVRGPAVLTDRTIRARPPFERFAAPRALLARLVWTSQSRQPVRLTAGRLLAGQSHWLCASYCVGADQTGRLPADSAARPTCTPMKQHLTNHFRPDEEWRHGTRA